MIVTEYDGVDDYVLAQCDRCGFEKVVPHPGSRPLSVRCNCRRTDKRADKDGLSVSDQSASEHGPEKGE